MKITIEQLKQGIKSKLGGRALTNIPNFNSMIQETIFELMQNISLPSAIRETPFISPLSSSPYTWKVPNDFKDLISIYKKDYVRDNPSYQYGLYQTEFMRNASSIFLNVLDIEGEKFVNTRNLITNKVVIDNCEDETNGTLSTVGTAYEPEYEDLVSIDGKASISFKANTTADPYGIIKSGYRDIANIEGKKKIILALILPINVYNGITVRFGNDVSNYREQLITTTYSGERVKKGVNYLVFDIETATKTGTPTFDINYFRLVINDELTTNTDGYYIDSIVAVEDFDWYIRYYSTSIITDKYGARRPFNLIEEDGDYILLNDSEYMLFLKAFSVISATDIRPEGSQTELLVNQKGLEKLYDNFKSEYPSEKIIISSEY